MASLEACVRKRKGEEKEGCVDTKALPEALSQGSPLPHPVPQRQLALRLEVCNRVRCLFLHMFGVKQALALYLRTHVNAIFSASQVALVV